MFLVSLELGVITRAYACITEAQARDVEERAGDMDGYVPIVVEMLPGWPDADSYEGDPPDLLPTL